MFYGVSKEFFKESPSCGNEIEPSMNAIFVKTSNEPNLRTEKFSAVSLKVTAKFH